MKTYCKPAKVDVENTEFNIPAVRKAFDGKYKRTVQSKKYTQLRMQ